ncbi:hypothetical protein ACH5RR_002516 [Cinchona calisaya]|uniref:Uncharacterized protein n=1 Tax=Cinchona calisaya TaxID=153742 RepID=A0ABD3B708_9GENT
MCIGVFIWKAHPLHPFLLLLNRDEYHNRPTIPLGWWEAEEDDSQILGGRDALAGGTWLACTGDGRLAFLTNVRELYNSSSSQAQQQQPPKSRGHLPVRFLQSQKSPREFADELVEEAGQYNGFNLIVADLSSVSMVYITNRPKAHGTVATEVSPGIHVLSNAKLDTPWPKAQRLEQSFKDLMDKYGEGEVPLKEMSEKLMKDTTKDDESKLPQIYPPEWEYHLSSIFVDAQTPTGRYGTRSTSVLTVKTSGDITFFEKHLDNDSWKEQIISFRIRKRKDDIVSSYKNVLLK